MRYFFIVNPNSGKKKKQRHMIESLEIAAVRLGIKYEIHYTRGTKDGEIYVRNLCRKYSGTDEKLRIYACGGDGTINEVVNGAFGYGNVEIGAIPLGTGNDYIRNYGSAADFLNMEKQLTSDSVFSDLIRYEAEYGNVMTEGYCVNMFNVGFDCNVVDMTSKVKRIPLISGSLAYLISVAVILMRKRGADLSIYYSDGSYVRGKILLLAIANGCYCGGGVKGVPYSKTNDGLMDVSVVKSITRRMFVALFPSYAKGTHMEKAAVRKKDVIKYTKEEQLIIAANRESLRLCIDGEITTQKKAKFSIVHNAFKFIVPERSKT